MIHQSERFVCECGHYLDEHYPEPIDLKPLCEAGGCWCVGFHNVYKKPLLGKDIITCQCGHTITDHESRTCFAVGCDCDRFLTAWYDRLICCCGHESYEHIVLSDPFSHYICNGKWSDQGIPIPCCCIKYQETTQNKMWAEQEKERRPPFKERESLWRGIIKFLF